jgi:hypothetical protein
VVIKSVSTAIPSGAAVVDFNGTGNYMTVGAAIAAIPANNTTPRVIYVKNGTYNERLNFPADKQNITLIGQSATGTILSCADTSASAGGTTNSSCTFVRGNGFTAKNITFRNNAGQTAGQAVALYVSGDRDSFYNVRVLGWQDTLMVNNGRHYFTNCYIAGRVDFIYGSATAVFDHCEIHSLASSVAVTAAPPIRPIRGATCSSTVVWRAGSLGDTTDRPAVAAADWSLIYIAGSTRTSVRGLEQLGQHGQRERRRGAGLGMRAWLEYVGTGELGACVVELRLRRSMRSRCCRTDGWSPAALVLDARELGTPLVSCRDRWLASESVSCSWGS